MRHLLEWIKSNPFFTADSVLIKFIIHNGDALIHGLFYGGGVAVIPF